MIKWCPHRCQWSRRPYLVRAYFTREGRVLFSVSIDQATRPSNWKYSIIFCSFNALEIRILMVKLWPAHLDGDGRIWLKVSTSLYEVSRLSLPGYLVVVVQFYSCSTAKSFINVACCLGGHLILSADFVCCATSKYKQQRVCCLGGQVILSAIFSNVCRATSNARLPWNISLFSHIPLGCCGWSGGQVIVSAIPANVS